MMVWGKKKKRETGSKMRETNFRKDAKNVTANYHPPKRTMQAFYQQIFRLLCA